MFSSTVRRAALSAPQPAILSSLTSATPRATVAQALAYSCHQRRFSSSKPSSPADGSKGIAGEQTVSTAPAKGGSKKPASAKGRPAGESKSSEASKKKARDVVAKSTEKGRDASMLHLPSVPNTKHIADGQICASDFFSLHRPISPTHSFPKTVTDDAFAAIFTPRTKTNVNSSEVITTLSNAVKNLDTVAGKFGGLKLGPRQHPWNEETDDVRAAITAESYRKAEEHLDNTTENSSMEFETHMFSNRYLPFHPPPAPVPMDTADSLAAGAELAEFMEPQHRTYTAVLTIEESTDANGDISYMAHTSELVAEDPPSTPTKFLERMQIRQERYKIQRAEENEMVAISVKRQRKLKMKKHKYKKLMRRTRNLRRKLDRN